MKECVKRLWNTLKTTFLNVKLQWLCKSHHLQCITSSKDSEKLEKSLCIRNNAEDLCWMPVVFGLSDNMVHHGKHAPVLFKFKKTSQHFRNSGCILSIDCWLQQQKFAFVTALSHTSFVPKTSRMNLAKKVILASLWDFQEFKIDKQWSNILQHHWTRVGTLIKEESDSLQTVSTDKGVKSQRQWY